MSTPSFVGTIDRSGRFRGRYVHYDGYPTAQGPTLSQIITRHHSDLPRILTILIDGFYGWSTLSADMRRDADTHLDGRDVAVAGYGLAYTTTDGQSHPDDWITGSLDGCFEMHSSCAWGYLFTGTDMSTDELVVIQVEPDGLGERYRDRARIPLRLLSEVREADWTTIECGERFERCTHYARAHFEVPEEARRLGTRTWLGQTPLQPPDAIGVTYEGRSYRLTGSGYGGAFRPGARANHWYAHAVDVRDGSTRDIPIYRRTPKKHLIREIPGVQLHYPPTAHNGRRR